MGREVLGSFFSHQTGPVYLVGQQHRPDSHWPESGRSISIRPLGWGCKALTYLQDFQCEDVGVGGALH